MNVLMLRHNMHQQVLERADDVYVVLDDSPGCRALPAETLARFAGVYRVSSYDSLAELSAVAGDLLSRGVRIDKVASFTEFTQYAAGYLCELLGLDHLLPPLVLRTRDKRLMKAVARDAGIAVADWYTLPGGSRAADPDDLADRIGLPMVLKPVAGWGAVSTTLVRDRAALADALADYAIDGALHSDHLMAEEFIDGEEFHVDAVWRDGEPWIFYVSRYHVPLLRRWTEGGLIGSILLDERDHAGLYDQMRELHVQFNKAVGFTRGTTHLEAFREHRTGRLVLSEVATRMGGANIGDLVAAKCGVHEGVVSLHELLDGERDALPLTGPAFRYLGVLALMPSGAGTITSIPDTAELLAHPNVVTATSFKRPGDTVPVLSPAMWCTLLIVGAETEQEVVAAAAEITDRFRIVTAPTDGPG